MRHSKQVVGSDGTKSSLRLAHRVIDEEEDNFLRSHPPGWGFYPRDEILIVCYLMNKIFNYDLPANNISEVNLYKYNPDTLVENCKEDEEETEWYFFTPRDRKYRNGNRPNRAAGDGYWKATGADKAIFYKCKKVGFKKIGFKKTLVFYRGKPPKGTKTNWIMHEYRVVDNLLPRRPSRGPNDMRLDDWVLCRIYEKADKSSCKGRSGQKDALTPEKDRLMGNPYPSEVINGFEVINNPMGDHISDAFQFGRPLQNYVFDVPQEPSHILTSNFSCMTDIGFDEQKNKKTMGVEDWNVSRFINLPALPSSTIFTENKYELKQVANECIDNDDLYRQLLPDPFFEPDDLLPSQDSLPDIPPVLPDQYGGRLN